MPSDGRERPGLTGWGVGGGRGGGVHGLEHIYTHERTPDEPRQHGSESGSARAPLSGSPGAVPKEPLQALTQRLRVQAPYPVEGFCLVTRSSRFQRLGLGYPVFSVDFRGTLPTTKGERRALLKT